MNLDWFGDSISFSSKLTDSNAFQRLGWKKTQNQNLEKNCSAIPNTKNFLQKRSSDNTVQIEIKKKSKLHYDSDGFTSSDNEKSTNNNSPASQLLQSEKVDFFMLNQENEDLKQKIIKLLENFGAKLEDSQIFNDSQQLKIRCFLNHIFSLSFTQIQQKQWCKKCEINLEKVQQMAEQKNGTVFTTRQNSE